MKKAIFSAMMAVCAVLVAVSTPSVELGYDFPLDEGGNKLIATFIALVASLASAVISLKKALVVLLFTTIVMAYFYGPLTLSAFCAMYALARVMADANPEIKDFILTPFKEEES